MLNLFIHDQSSGAGEKLIEDIAGWSFLVLESMKHVRSMHEISICLGVPI